MELTPEYFALQTAQVLRAEFAHMPDMPTSTRTFDNSGNPRDGDSD